MSGSIVGDCCRPFCAADSRVELGALDGHLELGTQWFSSNRKICDTKFKHKLGPCNDHFAPTARINRYVAAYHDLCIQKRDVIAELNILELVTMHYRKLLGTWCGQTPVLWPRLCPCTEVLFADGSNCCPVWAILGLAIQGSEFI